MTAEAIEKSKNKTNRNNMYYIIIRYIKRTILILKFKSLLITKPYNENTPHYKV